MYAHVIYTHDLCIWCILLYHCTDCTVDVDTSMHRHVNSSHGTPSTDIYAIYIYIWIAHNEYTMITMFLRTVENHIEITIVTSYSSEPYNVCDAPVYSRTFLVANYQFKWPTIKPFQHALAVASHDKHMHLFSSTITEDLSLKTTTCWQDVSQTTNSYETWICNIYIYNYIYIYIVHIHTYSYMCTWCTMVFRRQMGTKKPCHSGESSRNHWDVLGIGMAPAALV